MLNTRKTFLFLAIAGLVMKTNSNPAQRIFGGRKARDGQFPHQVSLNCENQHTCGGSILNDRWILTAAHCIDPEVPVSLCHVTLGSIFLAKGEKYELDLAISHPGFAMDHAQNDLALLRTKKAIKFNNFVRPISIRSSPVAEGTNVVASGWGSTEDAPVSNVLQFLNFQTISNSDCTLIMPDSDRSHVYHNSLCIVPSESFGTGVCNGDSGGSLTLNGQLVGVASWISVYCGSPFPDVYTQVYNYQGWIEGEMNRNSN